MKKLKLSFFCFIAFLSLSCNQKSSDDNAMADIESLIISTQGNVINLDLENNKIKWQYQSKYNLDGNRNLFSLSGDLLVQPFESGELIIFNINSGKIIWQEHILGGGSGIETGVANMDGSMDSTFVNSLKPLFMTQPLITENSVYITSTNQPNSENTPALYNFNKKTGEKIWVEDLPTVYNLFKPVLLNDFIFVNSAIYLNMYSKNEGTSTSYGVFDGADEYPDAQPNQFERPIYAQMQSDGKFLFVGDENGKFYALKFDKNNSLPVMDIMDPNNTFSKNPKLFSWKFDDSNITAIQEDGNTYLYNNSLLTAVRTENGKSAIIAIDKSNGKLKWKTALPAIEEWRLTGDIITATDGKFIYLLNTEGKITSTIETTENYFPLSNIEVDKNNDLLYASEKGIVKYIVKNKKFEIILRKPFVKDEHNYFQVKYLNKK